MEGQPRELTWTEKIAKWGDDINTDTATKDELGEYVETKIYVHEREGFTDYNLWSLFKEEFEGWTKDSFKLLRRGTRTKLRLHLIKRGDYVAPYNNRYPISDSLFNVVNQEEQHEWTDQELSEALVQVNPMISVALRNRLNPTMTDLATKAQHSQQPQSQYQPVPILPTIPSQPRLLPPLLNAPATPPLTQSVARAVTIGKEVATIAKIYTDDQKYSGVSDSFDFKLAVFYDICNRSGLSEEGYMTAFPTMLKGLAQAHYYNCSLSNKPFDAACAHMRLAYRVLISGSPQALPPRLYSHTHTRSF